MCWCAPTTQRWSLTSFTRGVCARARCTNWHTRSSCGPRTSSSYWEHYLFLGTWMWDQTYCRDRGRGPGGRGGPLRNSSECAMSPLVLSSSSSSPRTGRYGTDMAEAASVRLSPDRSAPRSSDESTPRRCSPTVSSPVLAGPSMVLGPDFPPRRLSMGGSHQEGSPLTSRGCHSAPPPGVMENVGVAPEGAQLIASGLPAQVVETILQFRAPSTRKVYTLKWKFFTSWCRARQQDPVNCPVVQFLSICRLDSLQGYPTPQWRCMWRHYRLTTHRSMESQWANTPWWYASSAVHWGWGRQCVLASPRGTWRWC